MTELKRWLDDAPPDEIRRLLEVAREEDAPRRVLRRTLVALGASSATVVAGAGTSGAAATGAKLGLLGIVLKWGGVGFLSGTLVAGAVAGVQHLATTSERARPRPRVEFPEPAVTTSNPGPDLPHPSAPPVVMAPDAPDPPPIASDPPNTASLAPKAPHAAAPAGAEATARRARSVVELATVDAGAATAREVALVDAARSALRSGNTDATLRLLADYERQFAPSHLEPEVLYLRMQAQKAGGDLTAAHRSAELIVSRFPESPEGARAEDVLRPDGTATPAR